MAEQQQPIHAEWKQAWAALEDAESTLATIAAWLPDCRARNALERALAPLNVATWQACRKANEPAQVGAARFPDVPRA